MANRNKITKEQATEKLLALKPNQNQNKLSQFLKQENVKEFNRVLYSKAFLDMQGYKPFCIESEEICRQECQEFFELCLKYDIIPSIALSICSGFIVDFCPNAFMMLILSNLDISLFLIAAFILLASILVSSSWNCDSISRKISAKVFIFVILAYSLILQPLMFDH